MLSDLAGKILAWNQPSTSTTSINGDAHPHLHSHHSVHPNTSFVSQGVVCPQATQCA